MLRTVNQLLSPGGARGRLAIMIFHRVPRVVDPMFPLEPDAARFERDMRNVRRWFHVLPLEAAVARLRDGSLPARALAITFDDGYADNHDVALPILTRLNLTATFFIATSFLDGGCMWNDRVRDTIVAGVRARLGAAVEVDVSEVTVIPPERSGKYRYVISKVGH